MKIKKLFWFIVALAIAILFISCSTEVDNRDKTAAELKAEYEAALRKETHKRGFQEVMDDYVNRSEGSRFRCDHFVERGHSYLIFICSGDRFIIMHDPDCPCQQQQHTQPDSACCSALIPVSKEKSPGDIVVDTVND